MTIKNKQTELQNLYANNTKQVQNNIDTNTLSHTHTHARVYISYIKYANIGGMQFAPTRLIAGSRAPTWRRLTVNKTK